jgi:hypothetical protein
MLVWCYDNIERDGRIEIQLNKLAVEFGKSYRTIKDWWAALREGPFFCEQIDRGKRGWVVRMSEDWIDWHVMANNYPVYEGQHPALDDNGQGQHPALKGRQVPVKSPSSPDEGRDTALESSAYKEDQHDQRFTRSGDTFYKPMFAAIAAACRIDLKICTAAQRNQVAQTTKALRKAGKLPEEIPKVEAYWYSRDWRGKKGEVPRPAQLQEIWQQAIHTNGKNPERAIMQETDLDKGF